MIGTGPFLAVQSYHFENEAPTKVSMHVVRETTKYSKSGTYYSI